MLSWKQKKRISLYFFPGRSEYGCAFRQTSPRVSWQVWHLSLSRVLLDGHSVRQMARFSQYSLMCFDSLLRFSASMSSKRSSPTAANCWNISGLPLGVYAKTGHLSGYVILNCLELRLTTNHSHAMFTFNTLMVAYNSVGTTRVWIIPQSWPLAWFLEKLQLWSLPDLFNHCGGKEGNQTYHSLPWCRLWLNISM